MKARIINIDGRLPVLRITALALTSGKRHQVRLAIDRTRELAVWCRENRYYSRWAECCGDLRALAQEWRFRVYSGGVAL